MKEIRVVDAIIFQDGSNPAFKAWVDVEEAERLFDYGFKQGQPVMVRDATDRPIPENLRNGLTEITDIMIRLEPSVEVSLN